MPTEVPTKLSEKFWLSKKLDTVDLEGQSSTDNVDIGPKINSEILELKKDGAYVSGKIQGLNLSLLVDSGSSATIINPSVYQKIPITSRPRLETASTSMTTASGDKLKCEGKGKFTLEIDDRKIEHTVWVAEIEGNGILGYDFLSQHDCCLNLRKGELLFGEFPSSPYDDDEFDQVKCCRIATNLDMVLPPESEVLIPAHFVDKPSLLNCGVVEPTFEFDEKYDEVLMAKSVVDTNAEDVVIRVLNPSDEVQRIYKNMIIATCEPISESEIFPVTYADENDETNENVHCNSVNLDNTANLDKSEKEPIPDHLKDLYRESCIGLNEYQRAKLRRLLIKFKDLFAKHKYDLGYSEAVLHRINVGKAKPIKDHPRRLPIHQREI